MMLPALKKSHKIYIMSALLIGASYLTYYYHVILDTDIIFTHLFYIPIALACIWWQRRGIVVALFFGAMLLTSPALLLSNFPLVHDVFRSLMFVAAAAVVALLSEQAERANILYRTVADSSHTGIYIIQDGKFRYLNRNAARQAGYAAAEMMGMDPLTVVHPEDRKLVKDNAFSMLRGKLSAPYEYRIIDKEGKIRYIMETVTPVEYQGDRAVLGNVVDITDRKESEEALRIHNQRFFGVLNSLDALVYVTDMQTNELLFINKYGRDIWGDIEGKICWQTIQAGQTGPCEFCTNGLLVGPDEKPTEGVVWDFQNTVNGHWYECRDRAIYWPDGRIVRMEIATDVTTRKQNEEALDRYRKQIELILESVGDGIYGVDLSGGTAFANPSALQITGYEVGDLIGMDQHAVLHHTKADGSPYPVEECQIHRTLQDGKIRHVIDEVFWKKDGASFPVEYVVAPMIENNRSTGAVVVFKDITERKRAEDELRLSEERYRTILRDIEDGYHEVDLAGSFTFFNESFRKIMGYSQEELLGMNYKQYAADRESAKKVRGFYNTVYRTGEPVQGFDWDVIRKDGERRTVEVSVSLISDAEGRPEGFRGIVRDITERRQVENERERLISELQKALSEVKKLSGLLPICASCKKIRDDKGYWKQIEAYISDHSEAEFSHGICPDCMQKLYPELL